MHLKKTASHWMILLGMALLKVQHLSCTSTCTCYVESYSYYGFSREWYYCCFEVCFSVAYSSSSRPWPIYRGRLVVDPNQMKKFLYGTSTSSPASSSSRPAANTVSWPILYFLLLFLYFFSVVGSICIDFFAFISFNFYLHPLAPICIRFHRWQSLRHPIGNLPQVHHEVDGFEKLVDS